MFGHDDGATSGPPAVVATRRSSSSSSGAAMTARPATWTLPEDITEVFVAWDQNAADERDQRTEWT